MHFSKEHNAMKMMMAEINNQIEKFCHMGCSAAYGQAPTMPKIFRIILSGWPEDIRNNAETKQFKHVDDILSEHWDDFSLHERYYWTITQWEERHVKNTPKWVTEAMIVIVNRHLDKCPKCTKMAIEQDWQHFTPRVAA